MKKLTAGLLMGTGATVAAAAAVGAASYASAKYMMKVALDRQQPKFPYMEFAKQHISGQKSSTAVQNGIAALRERLETTPHDVVQIESYDGQRLVGHWFQNPNPKRILVAMHGWRSSWAGDFGLIADFWLKNGCSILFAEQRGQGRSGGAYMGFGMMERYDCLEWVKWINTHWGRLLPVYLAGISMGASTVLMASNLPLPDNVCGIMADCGFTSAHDIWKHVSQKNLHIPYPLQEGFANSFCRQKIHMGAKACSTVQCLKQTKVPVLFAHGTQDKFVPVEMTYANYRACGAPKRLMVVPGAGHGMSYYMEKARYEKEMLAFWEDFDKKVKG